MIPYDKRSGKIWYNADLVDWGDVKLLVVGMGLLYGFCVFEVIRVSSFAILLSIMATLLPAISAFKRNPSEGLHHE